MEEIKIQVLEKTEIYTRLLASYNGKEYKFDISSSVPEEEVIRMAEQYITLKEKLYS
jgi:hypothetical protein